MNKDKQELTELSQSFAGLIDNLKNVSAKFKDNNTNTDKKDPDVNSQIQGCMEAIYDIASNLHGRINRLQENIWNYTDSHASGHLPPCPSTEHMQGAIKALGWDKNYEVKKKTVFASKGLFEIRPNKNR